jgi:enoyl-CoA hydratase/carnithine racemase
MTADQKVLYEKNDRVALITLNRPEIKNAIDPEMDQRLAELWQKFRDDDSLDVAILTGRGDAFCSGADLNTWFAQWVGADATTIRRNAEGVGFGGLTRGIDGLYKPVIAAINGWALGGGLEIVLACDIRIASERAMFGLPLVRYGFHTGDGGMSRLAAICGLGVALDLQLTAEPIDAHQALQCNLVTRVVDHDRLGDEALGVARRILANNQAAVRSAKQTAFEVIGRPLADQLRIEALNGYSVTRAGQPLLAALDGR